MADWDQRFLSLAKHISSWSKDPSSKVGAVIADSRNRVVSLGFNGFPTGIEDTEERLNTRDVKYQLVVHAEMNALLFATRDLSGCTLYLTHPSCCACAAKVIQSGIKRVVFDTPSETFAERWKDSLKLSAEMFEEAGVEVMEIPIASTATG